MRKEGNRVEIEVREGEAEKKGKLGGQNTWLEAK